MNEKEIYNLALLASIEAGKAILQIYEQDFSIRYKGDQSPLTEADKWAHEIIVSYLSQSDIPILSEEGKSISFEERKTWNKLWIVDPLDGTKEFIKRNGEFTVNIALVENGTPVFGVVYAPVLDELYLGIVREGAWKIRAAREKVFLNLENIKEPEAISLPVKRNKNYLVVVASRSHQTEETNVYIESIKGDHSNVQIVSKGSSLKLCLVAEGLADVYPRFAPTREWDTAAGHAVAVASGAQVVWVLNEHKALKYNKEDVLNPWFIVRRISGSEDQ